MRIKQSISNLNQVQVNNLNGGKDPKEIESLKVSQITKEGVQSMAG